MPMFAGPIAEDPGPVAVLLVGIAILGPVVGIHLVRRLSDPGPLARGEARWRYRSRPAREQLAATISALVSSRTIGWWTTRLEFAVAIAFAMLAAAIAVLAAPWDPLTGYDGPPRLLVWLAGSAAGAVGILVGLAWMVRIYRAPLRFDSSASWRYRDRPDGS